MDVVVVLLAIWFVVVGLVIPSKAHTAILLLLVAPEKVQVIVDDVVKAFVTVQYQTEQTFKTAGVLFNLTHVFPEESEIDVRTIPFPLRLPRIKNRPTGTETVTVIVEILVETALNVSPTFCTRRTLIVPPHMQHSPTLLLWCHK